MAIIVPILSTFDPKGVNQADKSFAGITKQANILKTALAGIGIAATVKGLQSTVMAASNLSESIAKSNTVFGKNAEAIQDWSKTTASALGVSRQAALEAAGTYGNLFRAFGINESESARMSTALVTLAADLASFNNVPIEDALLALRSGLSGETEPLKRFGIALNEARLKEQALADGLIKTTKGTLPQAIKTQAAYSLIMKDSALAQGDVARTAGGLANQLKFLKAGLDDAKAGFGQALLPIVLNVVTAFNQDLLPAIQNTTRAFGEQGVAGGFKTAGVEVANLLSNMTGLAKVIKDVVLALVGMKIAAVALAVAPPIIRGMTVAMETLYVATLLGAGGFNALKVAISGALASTGIGLLIVGLGLVVGKLIEMRLQAGATDKTVRFMESNGVQAFRNMGDAAYIANQKIAGNIITLNAVSLAASRAADEVDNIGIKRVKLGRVPPIAVPVPDAVTTSTTKATKAVVGLSDAAKLAQSNMAKLGDELSKSNDILSKAKDAYGNFKNTVSTAISSILDFGSAQTSSTDSISNAKDAQIELVKAQIEYDKSLKTDNIEAQEDALKSLQDAQKAATDSVTNRKTFLQVLQDQASLASTFSDKVKTLISMGLSETAIGQVLQAGADAGTKIADEIIAGGATVVDQVNTLTSATQSVADAVGESAATQFYSAGIAAGQALVDGVKAAIAAAGLSVTATGTIVNQAGIDQVNSAIAKAKGKKSKSGTKISKGERQSIMDLATSLGVEVPAFAKGGIVTGPTLALIGEAGPEAVVPLTGRNAGMGNTINLTINAGMGADGASIGREIVDAIKRYERTSGPVFASA
jgi:predicted transcriptional regulator